MEHGQQYRYVPGFIARRVPAVAALEHNPVFIRESGQGYGGARWTWIDSIYSLMLAAVLLNPVTLLALVLFYLSPIAVLILTFFIYISRYIQSDFADQLRQRWAEGKITQLQLSQLSHHDIAWGYGAAMLYRQSRFYLLLLPIVVGACTAISWTVVLLELRSNGYVSDLPALLVFPPLLSLMAGVLGLLTCSSARLLIMSAQLYTEGRGLMGGLPVMLIHSILIATMLMVALIPCGVLTLFIVPVNAMLPEPGGGLLKVIFSSVLVLIGFGLSLVLMLAVLRLSYDNFVRSAGKAFGAMLERLEENANLRESGKSMLSQLDFLEQARR